jgi:trigger factor
MNYSSSAEDVNPVTKKFTVTIPASEYSTKFEDSLHRVGQKASIKGFRPGKAPRKIVEQLYGEKVRFEVLDDLVASSLSQLVKEHELMMVGRPDIDMTPPEAGQDIAYTALIYLYPQPEITGYESFEVKVPKKTVTEERVEEVLTRAREAKATPKPLDFRVTAKEGDLLDAQISVQVEGEEPSRPEPLVFELGKGTLPKEIESQLEGLEVGTSREVEHTFPEEGTNQRLRGKKAKYKITLNQLSEKILPELTDEFIASLGGDEKTVLEFRASVRKELEAQDEKEAESEVQSAILEQLLARNDFEVPQVLVDDEIKNLLVRNGFIDPAKIDLERINPAPFRETMGEAAQKRVRIAVLVDRVVEKAEIKVSSEDIDKHYQEISSRYDIPVDEVRKFYVDQNRERSLQVELNRDKALEWLKGKAKIEYTTPEPSPQSE